MSKLKGVQGEAKTRGQTTAERTFLMSASFWTLYTEPPMLTRDTFLPDLFSTVSVMMFLSPLTMSASKARYEFSIQKI